MSTLKNYFSNKLLVFRAGIRKMPVRQANREDLFRSRGLHCFSRHFWQATDGTDV